MESTGKSWDMDLVDDIFNDRDAELIKRVPIPMCERNDSWFWLLDDKGVFTVKSSYRWLKGECASTYSSFWNKLWELKLPGKISQFLWRVWIGCLPTAGALSSKQIEDLIIAGPYPKKMSFFGVCGHDAYPTRSYRSLGSTYRMNKFESSSLLDLTPRRSHPSGLVNSGSVNKVANDGHKLK